MTVGRNTAEFIQSRGPEFTKTAPFTVGDHNEVQVTSMSDGTTTIVQVVCNGQPVGTGVAKRHPNDARNHEIGVTLAASRAFMDAGVNYAAALDGVLNPPPDPSAAAVKELRRLNKADSRRRKDIRRREARELHREVVGWDHTNYPTTWKPTYDDDDDATALGRLFRHLRKMRGE